MSIRKIVNLLQIICSYLVSRISRKAVHFGKPVAVSIEPTNLCNLRCPECPSGQGTLTRDRGFIDQGLFREVVETLAGELIYLTFYFQGEPYLHPGFLQMAGFASKKKVIVGSSTNGHFLTGEHSRDTVFSGIDSLIISLDGADHATYSSYRTGGSFEKVTEGIREIIRQKKEAGLPLPRIILQFLVLKTNEHQIGEIRKFGKNLGADKVEIKTAQFYDFVDGNPLMPDNPKFSRYAAKVSAEGKRTYYSRNPMPGHCFRMWSSCVITWDGWVVPCCFDKDAKYKMGNVRNEPFHTIWKSKKYRDFRYRIMHDRKNIDICRNCTEGTGITRFL